MKHILVYLRLSLSGDKDPPVLILGAHAVLTVRDAVVAVSSAVVTVRDAVATVNSAVMTVREAVVTMRDAADTVVTVEAGRCSGYSENSSSYSIF